MTDSNTMRHTVSHSSERWAKTRKRGTILICSHMAAKTYHFTSRFKSVHVTTLRY